MGHLRKLLRAAAAQCAVCWLTEGGAMSAWHTCTLPPGHTAGHACPCGARLAQAA